MTKVIKIGNNEDGIDCAYVHYIDDDKTPYWRVHFNMSRVHWALFENDYYDEDIKKFNEQDEDNQYRTLQQIPKYHVYKNNIKLGPALPRMTADGKPFLLIPKTHKTNKTKYISRNYYLYDVDDDFNINEKGSLKFYQ